MLNRRSFLSLLPKALLGAKLAPLVAIDEKRTIAYWHSKVFFCEPSTDKLWWSKEDVEPHCRGAYEGILRA